MERLNESMPMPTETPGVSPLSGTPPKVVSAPWEVTEPEKTHRLGFQDYVLNDAEPWHRTHLGRLYEDWRIYNRDHFAGRLVPPYILLSEPSTPRTYGSCGTVSGFGGRSQIRLRPSLLTGTHPHVRGGDPHAEGRRRFVTDVLLHEMIHQWHQEVAGISEAGYHGHGPAFAAECNRIGEALGLPPVRDGKKRGTRKDLPSCSCWPHDVRSDDWYLGAYVRPESNGIVTASPFPADPALRRAAFARLLDAAAARAWVDDLSAVFGLSPEPEGVPAGGDTERGAHGRATDPRRSTRRGSGDLSPGPERGAA